jgi:hypothetical protein
MRAVDEIHESGEVFDGEGGSLGWAQCDLRLDTHREESPDTALVGTIVPIVGSRAAAANGVSARFIGVHLACRLSNQRVIHFQWFDNDGHVYRAKISPEPE